jgi:hypothetical protein
LLLGAYCLIICEVHLIWLLTWTEISARPRYGHPKSWQVGVLARHKQILALAIPLDLLLFYASPLVVFWSVVSIWNLLRQRGKNPRVSRTRNVAFWLSLGSAAGVFLFDPFGAINWFMD